MKKYRSLRFFQKTNTKGCWNIASLHWWWSVTWRWVLSAQFTKSIRPRFYFSQRHKLPYFQIHIPFVLLVFQMQNNIRRKPAHWMYQIDELVNEIELPE